YSACHRRHRDLHSFPTRRSSDLTDSEGFFVAARRGTLFLDEIAELPPVLQAKLLRSLQEREVVPVGSSRPIEWHARIVCATNVRSEEHTSELQSRENLVCRLLLE